MDKTKETYVIIKRMKIKNHHEDVALVDSHSEVWELENKEKAEEIANILTKNSDSGWTYFVKAIKEKN